MEPRRNEKKNQTEARKTKHYFVLENKKGKSRMELLYEHHKFLNADVAAAILI